MDIEQRDEWLDQEQIEGTLFKKHVVEFTNKIIENNIDRVMENPIYNAPIQDFQDDVKQQQEDQEMKEMKEKMKEKHIKSNKQQALFDPLEDDDNQKWVNKNCKQQKRPLNCPSCFNQLAYNYELIEGDTDALTYICKNIFGAQVKENKIIRTPNLNQKMLWSGVGSKTAEEELKTREEAFNVKILVECDCGYSVGYFDINRESYILMNVI